MAAIVELFRDLLLGTELADSSLVWSGLVITIVIGIISFFVYKKESPSFDDWL